MMSISRRHLLHSAVVAAAGSTMFGALHHALADCAAPARFLVLHTPTNVPIPVSTAFVVSIQTAWNRNATYFDTRESQIVGTLRMGRTSIPLRAVSIAPQLARLVPQRTPAPGTYELALGPNGTALRTNVRLARIPLPPVPALPNVRTITARKVRAGRHMEIPTTAATLTLELAAALPAAIVGITASWSTGTTFPAPLSYGAVSAGSTTVEALKVPGSCDSLPLPNPIPVDGMNIVFQAVDHFGQLSATTRPVTLRFSSSP